MKIEVPTKLTINLSPKAISALDSLTDASGFGSRGRTIEETIFAVDELTRLGDQLLPILAQLGSQNASPEQSVKFLSALNSFIVYYIAQTARFRKPVRPSVSPPVPDAKSTGGRQQG